MTRAQNKCCRCGWAWFPRKKEASIICPSCKSPYWNIPRANQLPNDTRINEVYTTIKDAVTEAVKGFVGEKNTPETLIEMRRSICANIAKTLNIKELTQLIDADKS